MRIIDLACSNPNDFGYEVSQWSLPLLVAEIKMQGIAAQISEKSVSRFLKIRIYTPIKSDPGFILRKKRKQRNLLRGK